MNGIMNTLVDNTVQCVSCPVFDRLFQIVSSSAAAAYEKFSVICIIIFAVLFSAFIFNAVWQNIKGKEIDPFYQQSVKPVFINSIVALSFLAMGVMLPRFMTQITFEPAAEIALVYSQSMLQTDSQTINEKVSYQPMDMTEAGFFRPELRNTIIQLMKTTITQFQSYMKLGIAVMETAFTWNALLGIGALIKHIMLFFLGLYLFWGFFKIFVRFCFYFADIIVAMTYFSFFFPLSLVMMSFKDAQHVPKWMSSIGSSLGVGQFKTMINAIISLVAAVLTYTVIMVIIAKFFSAPDASVNELMDLIMTGNVFEADLSSDNLEMLTLTSGIVLVYIINFLAGQIPQITQMVLDTFEVKEEHKIGDELADNAMKFTGIAIDGVKKIGGIILNGGGEKKEDKK